MAARAERLGDRGPSAPAHWEAGLGTGEAHVLVTVYAVDDEHLERRARGAARRRRRAGAIDDRPRAARRGADRRRATTSASSTGSPSRRSRAAAWRRGPATASPTARGGWRDVAHRRVPARLHRRGRRAARRAGARRSTATARSSSTASCAMDVGRLPALRRRPARATRAARSSWRPRSSAAGRTARRSRSRPTRPDAAIAGDPRADQRLLLRRRPATACAARSAPTSAAPTRATRDGFFDGRLSNRHRIIRRGRPYGPPLPAGVTRGRRRRPRPGLRLLQRRASGASSRRSRRSGSTTATRSASAPTRTS